MTQPTAEAIARRLNGRRLACAESCTAGRLGAEFAVVDGAVDWFRGALVAYQTEIKRSLLDVTAEVVVSEQAAVQMAVGVSRLLDAEVTVATTGVIGDTPQDGVPTGTVVIATSVDDTTRAHRHQFAGSSDDMCQQAISTALDSLLSHLEASRTAETRGLPTPKWASRSPSQPAVRAGVDHRCDPERCRSSPQE